MEKAKRIGFLLTVILLIPYSLKAEEGERDAPVVILQNGYFRTFGHYLRHIDEQNVINNTGWLDMRFRYEPSIQVSNLISINAQIDMLDNVVWGHQPLEGEIAVLETVPTDAGLETLSDTGSQGVLSLLYGPAGTSRNFSVKRLWLEIALPNEKFPLQIRIGRLASKWGMGIWENSGCEYTSTRCSLTLDKQTFRQEWGDSRF